MLSNVVLRSQSTFCSLLLHIFKIHFLTNLKWNRFNYSLSIESKTNILSVNINFTGNLFLGFGRYCDKLYPESAVFHLFWAPALARNVFSVFYSRWLLVNNSRNKRVSAFLLCFIGFEIINFYILFIKINGQAVLVLALGAHDNLWFLLISLLVPHQNSPDTLPLM